MGSSKEKGISGWVIWQSVLEMCSEQGTSSLPQEALQQLTLVPHEWGVKREGSDTAAKHCDSVPQVDSEHSGQELYTPCWIFRKYKGRSLILIWVNVLLGCLFFIWALTIFSISCLLLWKGWKVFDHGATHLLFPPRGHVCYNNFGYEFLCACLCEKEIGG